MSNTTISILVIGGTGQQGGAVVNSLLATRRTDISISTLTRNLHSRPAQALSRRGVGLHHGDLRDGGSVSGALHGVTLAYLVTDFRGIEGVEGEVRQGKQFIDLAKEAGVQHIVFSSVAGADRAEPVDHFHSKFRIEEYLRVSGMKFTIIRPAGFMEVIPPPGIGRFFFMSAMGAVLGETQQKYISCRDIGRAVATAVLDPARYSNLTITLVGDIASVDTLIRSLEEGERKKGWGKIWLPRRLIIALAPHDYQQMFDWLFFANCQPGSLEETSGIVGNAMTIKSWAEAQEAERLDKKKEQ